MTVIDIKTTRGSAPPPTGRQRYEDDSSSVMSSTPFHFGMMLAALGLAAALTLVASALFRVGLRRYSSASS